MVARMLTSAPFFREIAKIQSSVAWKPYVRLSWNLKSGVFQPKSPYISIFSKFEEGGVNSIGWSEKEWPIIVPTINSRIVVLPLLWLQNSLILKPKESIASPTLYHIYPFMPHPMFQTPICLKSTMKVITRPCIHMTHAISYHHLVDLPAINYS